jgi:hypothetical protein
MTKRSTIFLLVVSFSIAVLAVRTQSGASTSNQTAKSADNDSSRNANEQEKSKLVKGVRLKGSGLSFCYCQYVIFVVVFCYAKKTTYRI